MSGAAGGIMMGAGAAMHIAGTALASNAAQMVQRKLDEIVAMPGVDVGSAYGEGLAAIRKNQGAAEASARATNTFSQAELSRMLESSIPGYAGLQKQRTDAAARMMAGSMPLSDQAMLRNRSVSAATAGGYAGSPSSRNLEARDFGLAENALVKAGADLTAGIIGSTPLARLIGTQDLLNVSGLDMTKLRMGERTQKMAAMRDRAIAPGATAVWGENLHWAGEKLIDMGSSMYGMSGGSSASMGQQGAQSGTGGGDPYGYGTGASSGGG